MKPATLCRPARRPARRPACRSALLATFLAVSTVSSARAATLDIRDLGDLFKSACVDTLARPDAIEAWARGARLEPLVNPRGLEVFAGGPQGEAWQIAESNVHYVVAVRAFSHGCAVYTDAADPAAARREFGAITAHLPASLGTARTPTERTGEGAYGRKTMLVVLGFGPANAILSTMMVMTQEGGDAPFRATMQLTNTRP